MERDFFASQVSELCASMDETLLVFRIQPLTEAKYRKNWTEKEGDSLI